MVIKLLVLIMHIITIYSGDFSELKQIVQAMSGDNIERFRNFLADSKIDPKSIITENSGFTLLHYTAQKGYVKVLECLLNEYGLACGGNKKGLTPLHVAEKEAVIDVLLKYKANPFARDHRNRSPWFYHVSKGRDALAQYLDNKVNDAQMKNIQDVLSRVEASVINHASRSSNELALLIQAMREDNIESLQLFLAKYKGTPLKDIKSENSGFTLAHYTSEKGYAKILAFLLMHYELNANQASKKGLYPLHVATTKGVVDVLCDIGQAKLEAKDDQGRTPFFYASYKKRYNIVDCLMRRGADLLATDQDGKYPEDFLLNESSTL